MPYPIGFQFSGVRCGLKNRRNDLGIILSDRPAQAAAVTTTNQVRAACVDITRVAVSDGRLRAVVVNSGNANCATGLQGARDARRMADLVSEALELPAGDVAVASTGVIGQLLDMAKVESGIAEAAQSLGESPAGFVDAILTTDLVSKEAEATVGASRLYGTAKGSGMIAPNMATMLGFIVTDANTEGMDLPAMLKRVADRTFNCMTVDSDTSTNDMLILMANGASGETPDARAFEEALCEVCLSLAKQVARDGEGATKLIEVRVTGSDDPMAIARAIGNSPLVKTAMFGCDPNWGRIMMAAGKAGVAFQPERAVLSIHAGGDEYTLFERGAPAAFDPKKVSTALKSDQVLIDLILAAGPTATVYTCDFGYGYVRINAEYHT